MCGAMLLALGAAQYRNLKIAGKPLNPLKAASVSSGISHLWINWFQGWAQYEIQELASQRGWILSEIVSRELR